MSALKPQPVTRADNPFLIYGDPSRANRKHAASPPPQARVATDVSVVGRWTEERRRYNFGVEDGSATLTAVWRSKKKRQEAFLGTLLGVMMLAVVSFALLPMPFQRQAFAWVGLGLKPAMVTVQAQEHSSEAASMPVQYSYISSPFGMRWGRRHQGIDLAASFGEPIQALGDGKVIHSGWESGYGNSVVLDHGQGRQTRYAHCSQLLVSEGQWVHQGDKIAKVGSTGHSTGPHLHLEVIVDGVRKNPALFYHFEQTPHWETASVRKVQEWTHSLADLMKLWRPS
jgi:murein DD-endopeptidase MepM/ murein hydrolase activator NlpD